MKRPITVTNVLIALISSALAFVTVCAQQVDKRSDQEQTLKIETTLVSVPVIVSDRQGRYIPGLKAEDFTLYEDRTKRQIDFFADVEEPVSVALLLDTSKSTTMVLDDIKKAAKEFIKQLRPQDRALIASFDYDARALCELTSDRKTLDKAIGKAGIGDQFGTKLRDAVAAVMENEFKAVKGRKAIVLLTDGQDFGSQVTERALLENAAEADVLIYPIFYQSVPAGLARSQRMGRRGGIFNRRFPGPPGRFPPSDRDDRRQGRNDRRQQRNREAINFLEELAEVSAGRYFNSEVADLKKSFSLIIEELRHQYRLGFYPPEHSAGSVHQLKVEVNRPESVVRSRRSYRIAGEVKSN